MVGGGCHRIFLENTNSDAITVNGEREGVIARKYWLVGDASWTFFLLIHTNKPRTSDTL